MSRSALEEMEAMLVNAWRAGVRAGWPVDKPLDAETRAMLDGMCVEDVARILRGGMESLPAFSEQPVTLSQ